MTVTLPETELDPVTKQTIEDLTAARDLIARHGLAKKTFRSYINARCSGGAIGDAIGGGPYAFIHTNRGERAAIALATTLGWTRVTEDRDVEASAARGLIYDYNDADVTTQADVLGLFDTTIARLRGE
ncbi:hypothetical protein A5747_13695 [Mycobacterium sp. IS-836]|uniref:DUF6197 family protein n=1 Tax=Mycobacterium sp. IS-836 TaxID=1834160 RepID=UPI00096E8BC8|nr:hypothetical protein [Mycobacterium sp. IS-836]OMC55437.1 hypothetical protein A5747_13695 [Mycobacterium sp. IS-836]